MALEERKTQEILLFGGQNSDMALENLPQGDFLYALNILNNSSGVGNKTLVTNMKGNLEVEFDLPDGENYCIGTAEDHENNKFYWFSWNKEGRHGIYQFDGLAKKVNRVLLNLVDTNGVDVLKFDKNFLILHADVVRDNLLYWVDGLNWARKTNINKLFDKSVTGYGLTVLESFITAYKKTSNFAPTVVYFSDTTKKFNRLYGSLRRFAQRFIYADGEKSNWSDFSSIALPDKEPFTGFKTIPTNNNGLKITVETGSSDVVKIEIAMQSTTGEANNEGILDFQLITTINKKRLNVSDDSTFIYSFYNDSVYPVTPYEKIIRSYSYLPKAPPCQCIAKNHLVYTGGKEGFEFVQIEIDVDTNYIDLNLEPGTEQKYNNPVFTFADIPGTGAYLYNRNLNHGEYMDLDGTSHYVTANKRANSLRVTIGFDVKKGNVYSGTLTNGDSVYPVNYEAKISDNATTVANQIKQQLLNQTGGNGGKIIRQIRGNRDSEIQPERMIYTNVPDGLGNVSFEFSIIDYTNAGYYGGSGGVTKVLVNSLSDTGESKRNQKLGSTVKYGLIYEDEEGGRKSLTYTDDNLIVPYKTINELIKVDGKTTMQQPITTLTINHKPPLWAKFYQIVRSPDLVYGDYIQMLIQKVIDIQNTTDDQYQDLLIGSLITYNKIHTNSNLQYSFDKGDRIRLIQKLDSGEYYDFFETEILNYLPVKTERVKSSVVTNGSATVTVASASKKNIGRMIVIDGSEREIMDSDDITTYDLNTPIGTTTATTYNFYDLVDNRGIIQIRKSNVSIADNSLVEIFKPAQGSAETLTKQFFEFQKKFPIINNGTAAAFHGGNLQQQNATQPAFVTIDEGTAYVRNRELPVTNNVPGAQVVVSPIEDPSFSDFYPSLINDNGRPNVEDTGVGEIKFGSRMRYSNNSIEDTKINGLNDFDALDYEDYNDKNGDIKRTVTDLSNIYAFKALHSSYVPIQAQVSTDEGGTVLRVGTTKLLNSMQLFPFEGGIGNNPEAFCSNDTHKYVLYANAGVVVRIGGNGEEPISKTFHLDKEFRDILSSASRNKAKIFMGFNRRLGLLIIMIEGYNEYIYFDGFKTWLTKSPTVPADTIFDLVDEPEFGTVTFSEEKTADYIANTGYVGPDHFTYRAFVNGQWSNPQKVCLNIKDNANRVKAWRPKESSFVCSLNELGFRNGLKGWTVLEEYYVDDNTTTGQEKPNVETDANYASPITDLVNCSIEYGNEVQSETFTRNNCAEGETGTSVVYTVPANKYKAGSVAAANALALEEIEEDGQDYANLNGTCATNVTPCGNATAYSGGEAFPSETTVVLGSDLGNVVLHYDAVGVPDKFIVEFDGVEVLNTGYRGDAGQQSTLNSALAAKGLPPETIAGGPAGTASFNKTSPTTTAVIKVYAPITGTAWSFTMDCPVDTEQVGNDEITESFTRNNCAEGETGSEVDYTVEADTYFADTKELANELAYDDVDANGQNHANSTGTCATTPPPDPCVSYQIQPIGGPASVEWFGCNGDFQSATISTPTTICTDGSGYNTTSGSIMETGTGTCA